MPQNTIRLDDLIKLGRVCSFGVVRVIHLGEIAISCLQHFRVTVRIDLQDLIVIDEGFFVRHLPLPLGAIRPKHEKSNIPYQPSRKETVAQELGWAIG